MPSVPWPSCLTLFVGGIGSLPSPVDHHSPPTTSSQVAAGLSRLRLHTAGRSSTATRPVQTSRNSLHHAASRSLTPPGQAIGYNRKRVSSFNRFFGLEFQFWKKFQFNITNGTLHSICIWSHKQQKWVSGDVVISYPSDTQTVGLHLLLLLGQISVKCDVYHGQVLTECPELWDAPTAVQEMSSFNIYLLLQHKLLSTDKWACQYYVALTKFDDTRLYKPASVKVSVMESPRPIRIVVNTADTWSARHTKTPSESKLSTLSVLVIT